MEDKLPATTWWRPPGDEALGPPACWPVPKAATSRRRRDGARQRATSRPCSRTCKVAERGDYQAPPSTIDRDVALCRQGEGFSRIYGARPIIWVICRTVARQSSSPRARAVASRARAPFPNSRIAMALRLYYTIVKNSQGRRPQARKELADPNPCKVRRVPVLIGPTARVTLRWLGERKAEGR
jgi:hypothetical protein